MPDIHSCFNRQRKIFRTILFYALENSKKRELPTIPEYLTCEIISAITSKVTGKKSFCDFYKERSDGQWAMCANEQALKVIRKSDFPEEFKRDLEAIVIFKFSNAYQKVTRSNMVSLIFAGLPYPFGKSTFNISPVTAEDLGWSPFNLDDKIRALCEEIGKRMVKYIERDIRYINENYSW